MGFCSPEARKIVWIINVYPGTDEKIDPEPV